MWTDHDDESNSGYPAADHDGATTCSMASDKDVDQDMDSLDEIDRRILASAIMSVDVAEVFSPARVSHLAAKLGLVPGASLDLTNGWDFNLAEDQTRAWNLIKKTVRYAIIGYPPCTLLSHVQELNTHSHRDGPEWLEAFDEEKQKATQHIDVCMALYRHQRTALHP